MFHKCFRSTVASLALLKTLTAVLTMLVRLSKDSSVTKDLPCLSESTPATVENKPNPILSLILFPVANTVYKWYLRTGKKLQVKIFTCVTVGKSVMSKMFAVSSRNVETISPLRRYPTRGFLEASSGCVCSWKKYTLVKLFHLYLVIAYPCRW